MDKLQKYLMLLLVATLSLTFTSCGGDEDEPNPPSEITDNPEYGGYVAYGDGIGVHMFAYEHSVNWGYVAEIYPSSDSFRCYRRRSVNTKIAFIGNFKRIEDINGLNGSYEWKVFSNDIGYFSFMNVTEKDCFLIEITRDGSSYYYIYQFGPSKKNLSGDVIGYYYNLQSYSVN